VVVVGAVIVLNSGCQQTQGFISWKHWTEPKAMSMEKSTSWSLPVVVMIAVLALGLVSSSDLGAARVQALVAAVKKTGLSSETTVCSVTMSAKSPNKNVF